VIDLAALLLLALLLVLAVAVVMPVPPFGGLYVPPTVKIGLTLLLAVALAPLVTMPEGLTLASLGAIVAREAAIGLALSMAVRVTIAGAEFGGHLAGVQMGFSYVSVIDPASGARNQMLSTLYGSLTVMTLLATNGHHTVLRALASSYRTLPLGPGAVSSELAAASARMFGLVLLLGAQLAAPIVFALLLVEVALGILSRSVPSLNMMSVGFGLRLLVGLLVIAAALAAVPTLASATLRQAFEASDLAARALR
jgi:flagellar biosynthetic protein FliR